MAHPTALYRSVCSGQAQCWSPSHSSSTPASRSPSLKDKSSSSRYVLVPSTAARSSQQALVIREYRSLMGTPRKDPQSCLSALSATPPWWRTPPWCHNLGAPCPGRVGERHNAAPEGPFGAPPHLSCPHGARCPRDAKGAHRRTRRRQPGVRSPSQSRRTPLSPSELSPSSSRARPGCSASSAASSAQQLSHSRHHCSLRESTENGDSAHLSRLLTCPSNPRDNTHPQVNGARPPPGHLPVSPGSSGAAPTHSPAALQFGCPHPHPRSRPRFGLRARLSPEHPQGTAPVPQRPAEQVDGARQLLPPPPHGEGTGMSSGSRDSRAAGEQSRGARTALSGAGSSRLRHRHTTPPIPSRGSSAREGSSGGTFVALEV